MSLEAMALGLMMFFWGMEKIKSGKCEKYLRFIYIITGLIVVIFGALLK